MKMTMQLNPNKNQYFHIPKMSGLETRVIFLNSQIKNIKQMLKEKGVQFRYAKCIQ